MNNVYFFDIIIEDTLTENGHVARGVCQTNAEGYLTDIVERTKIALRDGKIMFTEDDGAWRMYIYVDKALTYNKPKNADIFRNAGRSFGRFMKLLDGYPAATLMTFECGIRFLTDYLEGDVYFRTTHAEHNIVRARNQFKLVADMETHMAEMNAIVAKYKEKYKK